ncbi:SecY-interacting protein Syd [Bacillus sp. DX4.1]|uniref:SecY-interacting protein Syd n=1 Tax=Bacillus sp. DX4.1 TaxID=3055867 RepID=UPI0025A01954|nr:SecY-interacting protein Syd [Bacillus sp. DX4.1]MDM5186242.1 SecY-interacting protein Syd [Bacillus sp. DX4.1]
MKKIMQEYFERFVLKWNEFNGTFPQIPINEDLDTLMYIGQKDEEGYISWKPVEKNEYHDFKEFEEKLNVILHPDIKEYFNSFWFLEMIGWIEDYNINLFPVAPGVEPYLFMERVQEYLLKERETIYIPIGFESNGMLLVINNNTGEIFIEDFETEKLQFLGISLKSLISQLSFR